jgi:hypothetical protein
MADPRRSQLRGLRRLQESGQTGYALVTRTRSARGFLLAGALRRVAVSFVVFGREFHQKIWAGNTILLRGPCAEINQLAAFRAEGTPGIAFPGGRLTAKRASHGPDSTMPETEDQPSG